MIFKSGVDINIAHIQMDYMRKHDPSIPVVFTAIKILDSELQQEDFSFDVSDWEQLHLQIKMH